MHQITNEVLLYDEPQGKGLVSDESIEYNNEPISLVHVRLIDKTKERALHVDKSRESPENNEDYPQRSSLTPERLSPTKQLFKENIDKPLNIVISPKSTKPNPPKIIVRSATEDEASGSKLTQNELKITESIENLICNDDNSANSANNANAEKYNIKFVALKAFSSEPISNQNNPNTNSTDSTKAFTTKPVPPDRRRSVKDIIASINKSQSLLKINQDAMKNKLLDNDESNKSLEENNNSKSSKTICEETTPNNIDNKNNIDIKEISTYDMAESTSENNYCLNAIPIMVEKFEEFNNNNDEIFKKCNYRQDVEKLKNVNTKLEWNPVPKPRRSKNMANDDIEK